MGILGNCSYGVAIVVGGKTGYLFNSDSLFLVLEVLLGTKIPTYFLITLLRNVNNTLKFF